MSLESMSEAAGICPSDALVIDELVSVWREKLLRNQLKRRYYDGKNWLRNIGIAIPPELAVLDATVCWPQKAVDVLASRSVFDGFVFDGGYDCSEFDRVMRMNRFGMRYRRALAGELIHSCAFATVTRGGANQPKAVVRMFNAERASALWNFDECRIRAGMTIVDFKQFAPHCQYVPSKVDVFTDQSVIELDYDGRKWSATAMPNPTGRPLMEAFSYMPTELRPFGQSRISRAVMSVTDHAVREAVRTEISAETYTMPQKYLLGAKEEDFSIPKYQAYVSSIFLASRDRNGDLPQFGQLPQASMQPHIDYMRQLAAQFSGATAIPVSFLGVIHDNPSSAEAIYAAERELIVLAEALNRDNGDALENVARMVLAVIGNCRIDQLGDAEMNVCANFRNPSMPSMSAQADSMMKLCSAAPWIADTDVFLETVGFDEATRRRMLADKSRSQARASVAALMGAKASGEYTGGTV